jgi:hypothetical protein
MATLLAGFNIHSDSRFFENRRYSTNRSDRPYHRLNYAIRSADLKRVRLDFRGGVMVVTCRRAGNRRASSTRFLTPSFRYALLS